MPASISDKLRKKRSNFSTTLNGAIGAADTTVALNSTSGLPTDTAVTQTVDRVDANGVSTPTKMERISGVVSSNNLINCTRGLDNSPSAQSHASGAVVEDIWEALSWNDHIDHHLAEHNQAGTHKQVTNLDNNTAISQKDAAAVNRSILLLDSNNLLNSGVGGTTARRDFYIVDTGAADAYVITCVPALLAYTTGVKLRFKAANSNTTAVTVNVNGLGAKSIKKNDGATALVSGDIIAGQILEIVYDGTNFQMVSPVGTVSSSSIVSTTSFPPEATLINGKFVASVSSNNLTVALKGMDGNDPSASNKVYVRIGDTVRTVQAALSVTKNAATNWFNSGGSELATLEVDYFVYLGYNATDGVVIGFSRIPFARQYSDFSVTTTNEKYAAISTITTAASTDYYENIGRFAATLSAGAGYTWTVPTFTAINLIQRPTFETRWLTWATVFTGFSANPTGGTKQYKITGNQLLFTIYGMSNGTANATTCSFTLPITPATAQEFGGTVQVNDNGTFKSGYFQVSTALAQSVYIAFFQTAWSASSGNRNMYIPVYSVGI